MLIACAYQRHVTVIIDASPFRTRHFERSGESPACVSAAGTTVFSRHIIVRGIEEPTRIYV